MVCSDVQCYVLPLPYSWKGETSDVANIFWNEYKHQSKILEIQNNKHQYLRFSLKLKCPNFVVQMANGKETNDFFFK